MKSLSSKKLCAYALGAALIIFLAYRMVRPMNIFVVSEEFERPMATTDALFGLRSLSATECGGCHSDIYDEWAASMHAKAWTDPYYQVDFVFDDSQQICLNCHTPLQNQQENVVFGFRDREKFRPILAPNDAFDDALRREGVTCAVCHVRDGVIIGPYGSTSAPHPTRREPGMTDGIGVCRKCHVAFGKRWDTFYRIPPCGTVAEIEEGKTGTIDCAGCHMPKVDRPAWNGGIVRAGRMHLWRGGHDQETVRKALAVKLDLADPQGGRRRASVTVTNVGADHHLPTGTPDRHLTVELRLKGSAGQVLREQIYSLKRTILWRPFIVDLWDTRLAKEEAQTFVFEFRVDFDPVPTELEVVVRYHLLDETRRKRIGYENREPISYVVYQERVGLDTHRTALHRHGSGST